MCSISSSITPRIISATSRLPGSVMLRRLIMYGGMVASSSSRALCSHSFILVKSGLSGIAPHPIAVKVIAEPQRQSDQGERRIDCTNRREDRVGTDVEVFHAMPVQVGINNCDDGHTTSREGHALNV